MSESNTPEEKLQKIMERNPSIDSNVVRTANEQMKALAAAGLVEQPTYSIEPSLGTPIATSQGPLRCENSGESWLLEG